MILSFLKRIPNDKVSDFVKTIKDVLDSYDSELEKLMITPNIETNDDTTVKTE